MEGEQFSEKFSAQKRDRSPGLSFHRLESIVTQGVDGVQLGRLVGGEIAEQDAHRHGDAEGHTDAASRGHSHEAVVAGAQHQSDDIGQHVGHEDAQYDADGTADGGGSAGLNDELAADVPAFGTQGFSDADLPGPLRDGHQHDIHDTDAAHQQADGRDEDQDHHQGVQHGVHGRS